uniref:Uncharacterized protein n=1 Tax=viral metagenome TaxID=1070528 RepID=A0A6M3LJM4_9ZZZZ
MDREHCLDHTDNCERLAALESKKGNGTQYVTYKWLIGTIISLGAVIIGSTITLSGITDKKNEKLETKIERIVETKADRTSVSTIIFDVEAIKKSNNRMDKNLVLVMRALNIKPETE